MKTLLKLIGLCAFAICINVGCKKTAFDNSGKNEIKGVFNVNTVKEWYYTVFNKSDEFGSSKANNTKLPRWKFANYKKVGNMEFIEV